MRLTLPPGTRLQDLSTVPGADGQVLLQFRLRVLWWGWPVLCYRHLRERGHARGVAALVALWLWPASMWRARQEARHAR